MPDSPLSGLRPYRACRMRRHPVWAIGMPFSGNAFFSIKTQPPNRPHPQFLRHFFAHMAHLPRRDVPPYEPGVSSSSIASKSISLNSNCTFSLKTGRVFQPSGKL
jgi:hypothetical protein